MKEVDNKKVAWVISGYKIIASLLILALGITLFAFKCNITNAEDFFAQEELMEHEHDVLLSHLLTHVNHNSFLPTCFLSGGFIIFACVEIFLSIMLIYRKRWGAIWLFAVSFAWILFTLFFVSRFLMISKEWSIVIELFILLFLLKLILSAKEFFKK